MSKKELLLENKALKEQNAALKFRQEQLERMIFGSKKERFVPTTQDPQQLTIFGDPTDIEAPVATQSVTYERRKAKAHPGRQALPEHLPVEETVIEPEGVEEDWVKIGEEITETVDYTPANLVKKRVIRPKYSVPSTQSITIADLPERSMPKCIAEPGFVAHFLVRKFVEHMPFYRQIAQIKRDHQWEIPSSTLGNWFTQACKLLGPLYNLLLDSTISSTYLQVDESPIKVLDSDKPKASHQGYQWVYHSPERRLILFDYRKGRGRAGPKEILKGYIGIIQCDGWQVYDKIAQGNPTILLAGCLAHARRKFYEAKSMDALRANHALSVIKDIYMHERAAKQSPDRHAYRIQHMLPLLEELKHWAEEQCLSTTPKSIISKALGYFLNQYHKLSAIFTDGRIELDNNLIENKIRPLALGRKNYLFAGSHSGARRIAMMYSFFATCQANDINPYQWLTYTLTNIHKAKLSELHTFLPNNFKT